MTLLIVLLNSLAAAWLARRYKRAILGFEPEQIGRLYAELDCTLRSVREDPHHRRAGLAHLPQSQWHPPAAP